MGRWTLHPGLELTVTPCRKNLCPSPANLDRASLQIRVGEGAGGGMGGKGEEAALDAAAAGAGPCSARWRRFPRDLRQNGLAGAPAQRHITPPGSSNSGSPWIPSRRPRGASQGPGSTPGLSHPGAPTILYFFFFLIFLTFIHFPETECEWGRGRERGRVQSRMRGSNSRTVRF